MRRFPWLFSSMKPKTIPKPIFTLIYVLLLVALAAACCYFIIARVVMENPHPALFGYSVARIITGSMEPTISVNDIVITKSQKEYNKDDIVSYVLVPTSRSRAARPRFIRSTTSLWLLADAN